MDAGTSNIIFGFIGFVIGAITGYFGHDIMKKTLQIDEANSKNFLLFVVTIVWAVGMIVGIVNPAYQVPIPVHALMGAIVGFFFYKPKQS